MKKILILSVVILVITGLAIMGAKTVSRKNEQNEIAEKVKELPLFSFKSIAGNSYTNDSITGNKPVVIIHFSPDCEHCQYEAEEISKNYTEFSKVEVLMVTAADSSKANTFALKYHLFNYKNINLLTYTGNAFYNIFGISTVPAVFIYNSNHKLVDRILGEVKISIVTKQLEHLL